VYRRYAIVSDADLQEGARKLAGSGATRRAGTLPGTAFNFRSCPAQVTA
jgi:hypothetical protein